MEIKKFFQNAFQDMKESAKAQHEVNKANFAAAKAESRARFEEAKAMGNPNRHKKVMQAERNAQIEEASKRAAAAQARIDAVQGKNKNV